jgi:hypothetical protein
MGRHYAFQPRISIPLVRSITREGSGMIKLRAKASAVIAAAAIVTTGSAVGLTVLTATPTDAFTCHQGLVSNGSDYLDDYGGGSGTYVHTYPYTNSANQHWCLEVASEGGYYFHPANNYGLCLDTHTYNSGQQVWVYTCNGTEPQRWCWNGTTGYIVTRHETDRALKDNGTYNIVTIVGPGMGANQWTFSGNTTPPPDHC